MKEPKRKELFAKDKKFLEILSLAIENTGNNKIKMELGSIYQKYVNDLKGNGYDISRYTNDDNSVQKKQERIQECEKMTVLTEQQDAILMAIKTLIKGLKNLDKKEFKINIKSNKIYIFLFFKYLVFADFY